MQQKTLQFAKDLQGSISMYEEHKASIEQRLKLRLGYDLFTGHAGGGLHNLLLCPEFCPIAGEEFYSIYLHRVQAKIDRMKKQMDELNDDNCPDEWNKKDSLPPLKTIQQG